jgi:hypothetical protein
MWVAVIALSRWLLDPTSAHRMETGGACLKRHVKLNPNRVVAGPIQNPKGSATLVLGNADDFDRIPGSGIGSSRAIASAQMRIDCGRGSTRFQHQELSS